LQALRLNLFALEIEGPWDNGDPIGCFGERCQGVRCAAFEANIGCNASNAANGIERDPRGLPRIAHQDRHPVQSPQVYHTAGSEAVARMRKHEQRDRGQGLGFQLLVSAVYDGDGEMKRAELHHFDLLCAARLDQIDANVRVDSFVLAQKRGKEAGNCLWRAADAQHACFAAAERLCAGQSSLSLVCERAAVTQKFLAVARQNQPAIDMIKESEPDISLQSLDLT